jgi:hypothetical protein
MDLAKMELHIGTECIKHLKELSRSAAENLYLNRWVPKGKLIYMEPGKKVSLSLSLSLSLSNLTRRSILE